MAQYGGDLPNLATVESALGTLFVSDTDWTLVAEDVDGEYFKVTAVPEPSTLAPCLLGLACLLIRRRRRQVHRSRSRIDGAGRFLHCIRGMSLESHAVVEG